jgi:hypothetical protein
MAVIAAAAEQELRAGAQMMDLTVNKLRAMLGVRNQLKGFSAKATKAALIDRLVDAMQGYLCDDPVALVGTAPMECDDVVATVDTMPNEGDNEEDVPSSLTPN